jgi:hypothetical protein
MALTVPEVARILRVGENVVQSYIASGRLAFEIEGTRVVIAEAVLDSFIARSSKPEGTRGIMASESRKPSSAETSLESVAGQLKILQHSLDEKWDLLARNQELHLEILNLREEIARKELEIQKLRLDLSHHQTLREKEMEEYRNGMSESLWTKLVRMLTWS